MSRALARLSGTQSTGLISDFAMPEYWAKRFLAGSGPVTLRPIKQKNPRSWPRAVQIAWSFRAPRDNAGPVQEDAIP
jgi:hypothetical protein